MLSRLLKFIELSNKSTKIASGILLVGLVVIIIWNWEKKGFNKKAHLAQAAFRERVIRKFSTSADNVIVDTFTQVFNARFQLIAENEQIFYEYNSAGELSKIISCLNQDCDIYLEKRFLKKDSAQYYLNTKLFQIEQNDAYFRIQSNETLENEPYINYIDSIVSMQIKKANSFFYIKTDTLLQTKYQYYDSLQRVQKEVCKDKKEDFYLEKVYSYDVNNQLIKTMISVKSTSGELYAQYYQTYSYDQKKRLKLIQTFKMPDSTLQSQVEYTYLQSS
ncbi:MAG: hypothetical protein RMJ97_09450 [Raineya sp.]|nr:hypothetical protein [Raineya sp.]MDW8297090.1 hypothetical protein [Raineya sp.]